ncbi:heavy metal translocating P-type ATPase [uncultured Cardiobacterium sp.]|uniref:heavy metal translocating P-type ATPase n=1 Tax=uncultured Cardiobacterium sp. TaxID=417619 RepID=UPI00261866A4|nr:heavy metal translocating P-type ATPase [uncultured Cardiobacterium sp.]
MTCYHCHRPILAGTDIHDDAGHAYCCTACRAVAAIISAHHLDQYYTVRDHPAPRPDTAYDHSHWQAYDLPDIAAQYTYHDGENNEIHLYIDGLHCAACTWLISRALERAHGITHTHINLTTGRAEIRWRDTPLSAILATIADLGYTPNLTTPDQEERRDHRRRNHDLLRLIVAGLGMMQVMMFATGLYTGAWLGIEREYEQLLRWISALTSAPIMLYAGYPFLKNTWLALKQRRLNMDVPIAIACAGAWLASLYHTLLGHGEIYYDGVTMFIFFITISRTLEAHTRRRARHNQHHFARLLPDAVYQRAADGEYRLVPLPAIRVDDHIRVLPTHTIPVDGRIEAGTSRVDESMLSGESTPQYKQAGDTVLAGSTNLASPLDIRVTQTGQQTTLAAIRRISARAEQHRSPQIDRNETLARHTILAVLILAAAGYLIWQWIAPARAFDIALAVLVATCPCALSLATPTVLTAALNHAHKHAILIKNSDTLDCLTRIKRILFDKTGTLTVGKYQLRAGETYGDADPHILLAIAKTLETNSTHPVAWYFSRQETATLPMTNITQHSGKGVSGDWQGSRWHIGSAAYMQENGVSIPLPRGTGTARPQDEKGDGGEGIPYGETDTGAAASVHPSTVPKRHCGYAINTGRRLQENYARRQSPIPDTDEDTANTTHVYLAENTTLRAHYRLSDPERPGLAATLTALAARYHLAIASGDRSANVARLAARYHITDYHGDLRPNDKLALLEAHDPAHTLMIGDGINDAPVLARAAVSVAVGRANPLSQTHADIVLMQNGPDALPYLFDLATRTQRIIRQNLAWATAYNLLILPLALCGYLTPWIAALGMSTSSLLVTANALRIQRTAPPPGA